PVPQRFAGWLRHRELAGPVQVHRGVRPGQEERQRRVSVARRIKVSRAVVHEHDRRQRCLHWCGWPRVQGQVDGVHNARLWKIPM
ncbi:unnamed protein product, partial [Effrenium voratum]